MAKNKQALHLLQHFLIGFVLTLKGADKISHHTLIGGFILLSGIAILLFFFYSLITKNHSEKANIIIHLVEAVVLLFTAYIFFTEDKKYLQWVTLLCSIGFFISVVILYTRMKKNQHVL